MANRLAALGKMDEQDMQDEQDERLPRRKRPSPVRFLGSASV